MSEQEQEPGSMAELLERMEAARAAFYATVEGLSDEQLAAPITASDWSVADHMAHIAVWMEGIRQALDGANRWTAMGAPGATNPSDFDALNDQLRAPHAGKSPAETRAWLDATHAGMAAKLRTLSFEDLQRPYSHYQPAEQRDDAGEPFLGWVIADTYGHYDEHRGWIAAALRERGWG